MCFQALKGRNSGSIWIAGERENKEIPFPLIHVHSRFLPSPVRRETLAAHQRIYPCVLPCPAEGPEHPTCGTEPRMRAFLRPRVLLPLLLLVAFTGCITIEENYTFKKNGSGTMEYVVDMSELGDMMKAFEELDKSGGKKDDGMGSVDLHDEMTQLKAVPGIKGVKVDDKKKYVQRLKFSFADITALNAALNVLMPDSTGVVFTFFTWDGNTLVRNTNSHARDMGTSMGKGSDDPSDTTDMTGFLENMKYKFSFAFKDEVGNTSVATGVDMENPTKKSVKLNTDWSVITKDPKALDLRIELKK